MSVFSILDVVTGLIEGLFNSLIEALVTPLFDFLETVALSPESLLRMEAVLNLHSVTLGIGYGLLSLLLVWTGFKSMFGWTGIQTEEPHAVAFKAIPIGILVFYMKDIMLYFVEQASDALSAILDVSNVTGHLEGIAFFSGFGGFIGPALAMGPIGFITVLALLIGVLILSYKMFVRLAMCALLVVCAPMATATLMSKTTAGFFDGFLKLFIGNVVIQIIQSLCVVGLVSLIAGSAVNLQFFNIMLTIALISVTNKLEDIVRDVSMTVGIGRDMQGALSRVSSGTLMVNQFQSIAARR